MVNIHSTKNLYAEYKASLQKIADIRYSIAVLQWDQETYMPPSGAGFRAQQIATLSVMAHELITGTNYANLLLSLVEKEDLSTTEKSNIQLSLYDYNKQKRLPASFVRIMSEAISQSYESWLAARKSDSYSIFQPDLSRLVLLKKQEADLLGYTTHPYNALLNEYERGCTVALLDKTFTEIRLPLKDLLNKINAQPQVNDAFLKQYFPRQEQWNFGTALLENLGFDFKAGRQDISEHPFTTNFSSRDVRITTRIDEHNFSNMTWSCIHELGHALYEQGLPEEQYGLPLGEYASLSIHESQSRLWENNVGRSAGFWNHHFGFLKSCFPDQFREINANDFFKGINKVQPSLIRTEADELTYHFHVMIRYELEKQLIEGSLDTNDIPAYWNDLYEKYLGVKVPDDKTGCLQDVHWSHGSFGYFPTYSLGSLYAAQFYAAAKKQLPDLETGITNGNTGSLLEWLRKNIHRFGREFTSEQLCETITGEPLNIGYFMEMVREKYEVIYSFRL